MKNAFRIYRTKNGLLQPEEIKRIREKYALERVSAFEVKTISKGGKIAYSMSPSDNYDIQNSKNYYGGLFYVCAG